MTDSGDGGMSSGGGMGCQNDANAGEPGRGDVSRLIDQTSVVALVCRASEGWPIETITPGVARWGYDAERLQSDRVSYAELIHPDDREWVSQALRERMAGPDTAASLSPNSEGAILDYRLSAPDGRIYWVEDRLAPRVDLGGGVTHLEGVLIDITERRKAQHALSIAQDRYRDLADLSPEGIIIADTRGTVTDCNRAFLQLTGYARQDIVGRHMTRLPTMATRDLPRNLALLARTLRNEASGPMRFWWVRRDGARRLGEARTSLVRENGRVLGLQAVLRDITDEDRSETLLSALNRAALAMQPAMALDEILNAAVNELAKLGVNCGVLEVVEDRHLRMRAMSFPPKLLAAAERLVGLDRETYLLRDFNQVDVYRRAVRERQTSYTADGESVIGLLLPPSKRRFAGQICRMLHMEHALAAPLMVGDRVVAVFTVNGKHLSPDDASAISAFAHQVSAAWARSELFADLEQSLTELQETQDRLRQVQKMDALGRLAGGVAHDFNNLLTVINGYSEMLLDMSSSSHPWHAEMTEIHNAGRRAEGLTRQLLAFSRRQPMEMQVISLNDVLRGMAAMLGRVIGEEIKLSLHTTPDLDRIKADPGQIEQVVVNLAVNARDAMPDGGTLDIRTERVVIEQGAVLERIGAVPPALDSGTYTVLSVRDTGTGMTPEVQERIFEPFFTTKAKGKGIGLGLATVYGIVTQSGGRIGVESLPGKGTEFAVFMPAARDEGPQRARDEGPVRRANGSGTVLLVEDDRGVRALTRRMLQKLGYQVVEAEDGMSALDICADADQVIDLVVSDVVMPGMRGPEFVRRAKRQRPELPVLYMSGYTDREMGQGKNDLEDAHLLVKPFRLDQLSSMIHEVLE